MTRRTIQTLRADSTCAICGRTLLRGEHVDIFFDGAERREVCELCTARAGYAGWIHEAEAHRQPPRRDPNEGRRSFLKALRQRRGRRGAHRDDGIADEGFEPEFDDAYGDEYAHPESADGPHGAEPAYEDPDAPAYPPEGGEAGWAEQAPEAAPDDDRDEAGGAAPLAAPHGEGEGAPAQPSDPEPDAQPGRQEAHHRQEAHPERHGSYESRDVYAVPSTDAMKTKRALEAFNASHHVRTVASIARSLGAPLVTVRVDHQRTGTVLIVVAWELSWYRFAVDLTDHAGAVQIVGRGDELSELAPEDKAANAAADEYGELTLAE